jgi:hypothetical protein
VIPSYPGYDTIIPSDPTAPSQIRPIQPKTEVSSTPDIEISNEVLKKWQIEIKLQEQSICNSRRNESNPENQTMPTVANKTEEFNHLFIEPITSYENTQTDTPHINHSRPSTTHPNATEIINQVGETFKLNLKQHQAFQIISNNFLDKCIKKIEGVKPLHMLLTGPGGTGKTHVVKAVKEVMRQYSSAHKIRFLAPTGSAASLIDGMTIHKGLGIKIVQHDGRGKGNRAPGESKEDYCPVVSIQNKIQLRDEWRNVEVALIDEISLLSQQIMCDLDQELRYAKEKPHEWFGGIIMIFSGDFFQYPPVMGTALYTPLSSYEKQSENTFKKRFGRTAWKTVDTVLELVEQHRMNLDPPYAEAVLRLRTRDCNIEDVELFNSRLIRSADNPHGVDMSSVENENAAVIV